MLTVSDLPEPIRSTHRDLSPEALAFLEFAFAQPADCWPRYREVADLPEWVRRYTYELQVWPTFLGAAKVEQITRVTVGVSRLVRAIPERVFGLDPQRLVDFYGFGDPAIVALLLEPPNGLRGALARCDYLDTESGIQVVEVNMGSHLGGWQLRFWEHLCRGGAAVARFIAERGLEPRHRDPLRVLFRHAVRDALAGGAAGDGCCNLLLGTTPDDYPVVRAGLDVLLEIYREALADVDPALVGRLDVYPYPNDLEAQGAQLFLHGRRIHSVVEYTDVDTPSSVYRCFKAGRLTLHTGPLKAFLGDKRNLALLSEHADSELFSAEERALIRDHVPWSREMGRREATFEGERRYLPDLLAADRGGFVLKPAAGRRGEGVVVGRFASDEQWRAAVDRAAGERGWLVQRHHRSRPYVYCTAAGEVVPHDVVWGTFAFGDDYGGGFLRMMPSDRGDGVINSARGATEGFLFEIG